MSFNAHELSNRLLNALDNNYNVVDMHTVNEIISILEKYNITKELLETTRLGKHVNELRRKTADPGLARRAKVLVKRWRDLVIPTAPSPGHTGSNRSSAERQMRMSRLGGTPLTSPALIRNVLSPAVASPRPALRPAWGGYESDSQDVILVDDDPPAAPPLPFPEKLDKAIKPSLSPVLVIEDKKSKRDKKPKKRRGHSRAGSGSEAAIADATWPARNGSASPMTATAPAPAAAPPPQRRNGCRRPQVDAYAALANRMPAAGAKKVKTTKELLEDIQSRGAKPTPVSPSRADSASPDVMLVEDPSPPIITVGSPLRNGSPLPPLPPTSPHRHRPHLDEYASREFAECTCEEEGLSDCPAAVSLALRPEHVIALHNGRVPGVNGTGAPVYPHQFAVRKLTEPDRPGLFTSVVPLYKYSDYADDYCVKNLSRVPLGQHLPFTKFAPSPPPPPKPPSPPPIRPYPVDDMVIKSEPVEPSEMEDSDALDRSEMEIEEGGVEGVNERLKSPPTCQEVTETKVEFPPPIEEVAPEEFESVRSEHRTVERTKVKDDEAMDGRALYELCAKARASIAFGYDQTESAPLASLHDDADALTAALATTDTVRDDLGRPLPATDFAEWHECAMLGDLIALPYVIQDD